MFEHSIKKFVSFETLFHLTRLYFMEEVGGY